MTLPAYDWLYYRVHLAGLDDFDPLLDAVVRPLVAEVRAETPHLRWFFLRFVDPTGPQLRLRIRVAPSAAERIGRLVEHRLLGASRGIQRFGRYLYAPETAKFGSGPGIELAERLFCAGSDAALDLVGPRYRTAPVALGAAHTMLMLGGLPTAQRPAFLHQYWWYWSGGATRGGSVRPAGRAVGPAGDTPPGDSHGVAARARRLVASAERLLSDPRTGDVLTRYRERFRAELDTALRRAVPRTDYFLLFHHLHLMNNRLGVYPGTEAGIARLLWTVARAGLDLTAGQLTDVIPTTCERRRELMTVHAGCRTPAVATVTP